MLILNLSTITGSSTSLYYNGQFTHEHVLYTAAFIDNIEKLLPRELNKANWGLKDPFINLAAGHHKPQTEMQWMIVTADRFEQRL